MHKLSPPFFDKGWSVHKYKDRYKMLPWEDGAIQRYNSITPDTPGAETLRWIDNRNKYEAIRKAKGRKQRGEVPA